MMGAKRTAKLSQARTALSATSLACVSGAAPCEGMFVVIAQTMRCSSRRVWVTITGRWDPVFLFSRAIRYPETPVLIIIEFALGLTPIKVRVSQTVRSVAIAAGIEFNFITLLLLIQVSVSSLRILARLASRSVAGNPSGPLLERG